MCIRKIDLIILMLVLSACSFQHPGDGAKSSTVNGIADLGIKADPSYDSNGDGIPDVVKAQRGLDPFIAGIPVVSSNFFQNFTIIVDYNKVNDSKPQSLTISTKIKDTDPSFSYRVGKLFGVDNSKIYAAKEGRFSGHAYGIVKNEDFTWVKYPTLDPLMLHSDIIKFRTIIDGADPVTSFKFENYSVKISLDSTVKLVGVRFKEIKDLSVNFYYHDYEKDSYVLLKNILINRTFQRNINENFSVEIENVPVEFLRDSYLKHGEFLVSEIDNYFIPELGKDYKTLMNSVKTKTIPVLLTTPSEDTVFYVAASGGISFLEILNRIFVKNFEVKNNTLTRIGQYENNLGSFEYLTEIKDKDKLGKWFVLTNQFKDHYLDHQYLPNDHITLSYLTGNELATQPESVQVSYSPKVATETYNETVTPIGVVSPNSKIEIQIKGINRFGHEAVSIPYNDSYSNSCNNCTHLQYSCNWIGNKRVEFLRDFDLNINYNLEWEKIFLVINEERFKLSTLIADKKVIIRNLDFSFQITIDDISKIKALKQAAENNISLVMLSTLEKKHQGIKLISQGGDQRYPWCGVRNPSTVSLANQYYEGEISNGSQDAAAIKSLIRDMQRFPSNTGSADYLKLKMMDDIDYEQNYSLAISSRVINFFN
jgi:hypothetical protein